MKLTEKQLEILELSKEMFSQKGYVETSMRDLAFQLNIKAASIYSHFKSKEEILTHICNHIANLMTAVMTEIRESGADNEGKFLHYIRLHITHVVQNLEAFGLYYKYWNLVDGESKRYGLLNFEYFEFIKNLVYDNFPKLQEQDFYIPNATPLIIIDLLNSIPKIINPENPDIDLIVADIQTRLLYGYKKDQ